MKISSKIYAQSLIDATTEESDLKKIARNFLDILAKNKQGRDLKKILNSLDEEYAKKNNAALAKLYSEKELSDSEIKDIKTKLEKRFSKNIFVKNIIKTEKIAGIMVEVEGILYDYSLSGKLTSFKKQLINSSFNH
jgi:F-type H+-transporting ATPase subunit delta